VEKVFPILKIPTQQHELVFQPNKFLTSVKKKKKKITLLYSLSPRSLWSDPAIAGLCSSGAAIVKDIKGQKNKEDDFFYIPCAYLFVVVFCRGGTRKF
jgi:hypothetical protein